MTSSMVMHNISADFRIFNNTTPNVSSLSFSQDRWMQDYLGDFRQRLNGRADAAHGGRVREKHARHTERK